MKYLVYNQTKSLDASLSISSKDFESLRKAQNCLRYALAIEEKYQVLLRNYINLENEALSISLQFATKNINEYADFFEVRLALNTSIANFLSSARLYFDQVTQNVQNTTFNNKEEKKQRKELKEFFKCLRSQEYDNRLEYRVMEALRNYTQHFDLPVHTTTHTSRWTSLCELGVMQNCTIASSTLEKLCLDNMLKPKLIEELKTHGIERIDLLDFSRGYLEGISNIHCSVRGKIKSAIDSARQLIEQTISQYLDNFGGSELGIAIGQSSETDIENVTPLMLKWDDVRIDLIAAYPQLHNLKKRVVSNRLSQSKHMDDSSERIANAPTV